MAAAQPVALVTGASSGIGQAATLALAGAGFRVAGARPGRRWSQRPVAATEGARSIPGAAADLRNS